MVFQVQAEETTLSRRGTTGGRSCIHVPRRFVHRHSTGCARNRKLNQLRLDELQSSTHGPVVKTVDFAQKPRAGYTQQ